MLRIANTSLDVGLSGQIIECGLNCADLNRVFFRTRKSVCLPEMLIF